ncbi:MAG: sugar ABC transporter permease [Anaerolineae bacterium]|uniref:carbohydrate ABC transporter permease n=2 Tax=Candidatus Amarolinea dominans TaxID=3140696 RepID=UPI0031362DB7|nr:sugar ABC transporter permease [Anaerolineae bacterium]
MSLTNSRPANVKNPNAAPGSGTWSLSAYETQARLFLIPFFLGSLILIVLPALITLGVAFTKYNAIQPPTWVGLNNFRALLASPLARLSLRISLQFIFLAVPLRLLGALLLALLLQQGGRLFGGLRAAVFLPTILPEGAYALIWLWILNPLYGPLNAVLHAVGLPTPDWLLDPATARMSLVLMSLFTIGEGMVLLLVGLKTIPRVIYEAARVDGANAWQSFWRISLPLLTPWLLLLTFRDIVVSLQNTFTPSFVMTYGGPYYATTFVPLLVFELAFDLFDFGLAAAMTVILYLLTSLLVVGIVNLVGLNRHDDIA